MYTQIGLNGFLSGGSKAIEPPTYWLGEMARSKMAFANSKQHSPARNFSGFSARALVSAVSNLPVETIRTLMDFRRNPSSSGVLLLKGFPIDSNLPNTPSEGKRSEDKLSFVSESNIVGVASLLGDVFGYTHEKNGEMVHDICPVESKRHVLSNEGSEVDFKFHIENAYYRFHPHFLLLHCLRSDSQRQASTTVATIKDALRLLSESD